VKSAIKGTSTKDESFECESADSFAITTGITVAAYVREEDSAKFFYWFGSNQVQGTEPAQMFSSVVQARSLSQVMDTVVRGMVQASLCTEMGKRKLMTLIGEKPQIIQAVQESLKKEFAEKGITISYIGFAGELGFAKEIQDILNEVFIVNAKHANKEAYQTTLIIEQKQAEIYQTRSIAETWKKWDGKITFPSFMVLSHDIMNAIMGWFKGDSSKK
jgi:hypothetical protein